MMTTGTAVANSTLTYFDMVPGRAEAIRLAFKLGGIPFKDHRIPFSEWRGDNSTPLKPSAPWRHVPFLTLSDGVTRVGQSRVILRLVGRCAGLYPSPSIDDADGLLRSARIDEVMDALDDLHMASKAVGAGFDRDKRAEARVQAAKEECGVIAQGLAEIDSFISTHGQNGHAVGSELTIADLAVFSMTSLLCSGFVEGVPKDTVSRYAHIQRCRKLVASLPQVMEHYDDRGELRDVEIFYSEARNIDV